MKSPSEVQVLIVDDEPDLLDMLAQLFKSFGFSVSKAENGQVAWDFLKRHKVDLVLTDVRMPQVDGIELLKRIRKKDSFKPSVLLTSGFTDHTVADLYALGANGFFSKPFGAAAIRNAVSRSVQAREERWGQISTDSSTRKLDRKFPSFKEMLTSGEIKFGSGGFFVRGTHLGFAVNDNVNFQITFANASPVAKVEGTGVVRWVKDTESEDGTPGVGIEIKTLANTCRTQVCKWIHDEEFIPFIPQ